MRSSVLAVQAVKVSKVATSQHKACRTDRRRFYWRSYVIQQSKDLVRIMRVVKCGKHYCQLCLPAQLIYHKTNPTG